MGDLKSPFCFSEVKIRIEVVMSDELDPIYFEKLLIKYMFMDKEVREKLIPYLTVTVFDDSACIDIIKLVQKHMEEYQKFPKAAELKFVMDGSTWNELIDISNIDTSEYDREFILDQLEEFFRNKLANEVILEARDGLVNDDKAKLNAAPDKLREALAFTFDTNIGLSVLTDADRMYSALHDRDKVVSSGLKTLDDLIEGGFHEKSLSLVLAECVTEDTIVSIKVECFGTCIYKNVEICEVEELLEQNIDVWVYSPDGYVKVLKYIDKGFKKIYDISINRFHYEPLKCSGKHLIETDKGWKTAEEIANSVDSGGYSGQCLVLTSDGYRNAVVEETGEKLRVVDLAVDHTNHRYFTNGISSHNSNLGKSLIKCSLATNSLLQNKNVLYLSLEMSEEKISERVLANLFDINLSDLKMLDKNKFMIKLQEHQQKLESNFYVVAYPPKSINANRIRAILKELQLKKKFVPDIIFVDYLGLMSPNATNKNSNTYSEQKTISEELRAIAVEFGMPIVSAVQTNRNGFGNAELDLTDIADSVGTVATADIIFGVTQTQEMRDAGRYSFLLLKNRYGENKKKRYIGVDYPKMRIYDVKDDSDEDRTIPKAPPEELVSNLMRKDRQNGKGKILNFE